MKQPILFFVALAAGLFPIWSVIAQGAGDVNARPASAHEHTNSPAPAVAEEGEIKADALIKEASVLITEGKEAEAEARLGQALAIAPGNAEADFLLRVLRDNPSLARRIAEDAQTNRAPNIQLPKVAIDEQRRRFEAAVRGVLARHGFVPALFTERRDSTWMMVSSRPRLLPLGARAESAYELLQVMVETEPGGQVTVRLIPYSWAGSAWAALGPLFQIPIGITRERVEICWQIQGQLNR